MKLREVLATFKRIFVKRKYKDILFRFVFKEKSEILQLYNAINKTNYTNPDDLVITTMEDVLVKHRAEVEDMFLTTFDKKMYEEALREDAREDLREELQEKIDKLSKDNAELSKKYEEQAVAHAKRLYENKVPYEVAREVVAELGEETLKKIYGV